MSGAIMTTVALSHRPSAHTPLAHSSSPLAPPLTQNTAPVLEFNCLYSHDVRRKNKRWQDGFLRYHTFNRRIMLYDVPRNFLGDSHWKGGEALQEGDEVDIEQSGILVQVAENIGRTETDLSGLIAKRSRKEQSGPILLDATPVNTSNSRHAGYAPVSTTHAHGKHRTLASLLGSRRGVVGKAALPEESPFELRHADRHTQGLHDGRPAKRQRTNAVAPNVGDSSHATTRPNQCRIQTERSSPPVPSPKEDVDGFIDLSTQDDGMRLTSSINSVRHEVNSPLQQKQASVSVYTSDGARHPAPKGTMNGQVSPAPRRITASPARVRTSGIYSEDRLAHEGEEPQNGGKRSKGSVVPPASDQRTEPRGNELLQETPPRSSVKPGRKPHTQQYAKEKAVEECSTLRLSSNAAKKNQLFCRGQLSKKSTGADTSSEAKSVGVPDAQTSNPSTIRDRAAKTQKQLLKERLKKSKPSVAIPAKETETLLRSPGQTQAPVKATVLDEAAVVVSEPTRPEQRMLEPEIVTDTATLHAPGVLRDKDSNRAARCPLSTNSKQNGSSATSVCPRASPPKKSTSGDRSAAAQAAPCLAKSSKSPTAPDTTTAQDGMSNNQPQSPTAPNPQTRREPRRETKTARQVTATGGAKQHSNQAFAAIPNEDLPIALPGPWSREAFDLFTWRPPGWDEEKWCIPEPDIRENGPPA